MKITHDNIAQAGYLRFSRRKIAKTVPVSDTIICDLDQKGQLCGIEILNLSKADLAALKKELRDSISS